MKRCNRGVRLSDDDERGMFSSREWWSMAILVLLISGIVLISIACANEIRERGLKGIVEEIWNGEGER